MLELRNLHKHFAPDTQVLRAVSLTVAREEIVCLLGPSGCGKSTLLRIVAGLETTDQGAVFFDGADITQAPAYRRGFGLMFQDYALFPHMSVADNVAFGLRMAGVAPADRAARVAELLALVNLHGYGDRTIDSLSGGEQQRVALARTLAPRPALVMLDEPLANLDRLLREELVQELRLILKQLRVSAIFVTHDQEEAFVLADRIIVMRSGRIEQEATPPQLYRHPANSFIAGFLGFQNLLAVTRDPAQPKQLLTAAGSFVLPDALPAETLARWRLLIPPDAVVLEDNSPGPAYTPLDGVVMATTFRGSLFRLTLAPLASAEAMRLVFEFRNRGRAATVIPGQTLRLWVDQSQLALIREG